MKGQIKPAWKAHTQSGELNSRADLSETVYAFPKQHKEPLIDADHVQNALARLVQVADATDADRDLAVSGILKAAHH